MADFAGYIPAGESIGQLVDSITSSSISITSPICIDPKIHIKNLLTQEGLLYEIRLYDKNAFSTRPWDINELKIDDT